MGGYVTRGGHPFYLTGVNYWPRQTGLLMWREWQPDAVQADLRQMKNLGINSFRSFLFFPDFMPKPGAVDPVMLERLGQFLRMCQDEELVTALTLFVGHMSGENWDVPWREGRNFYADPWMLEQERLYVHEIVGRFAKHPAILAWILSNEITLYAGNPDTASARHWLQAMVGAIRALDASRLVGSGGEIWLLSGAEGSSAARVFAEGADYAGPHVYPQEPDTLRHSYTPSAVVRALDGGKPIILEEFGCSNAFASEENQAGYLRTTFHSVLTAGGAGAWAWCFSDFDLPNRRPYAHHPFEMRFGLVRADGSLKPAARVVEEFTESLKQIDLERFMVPKPVSRLIVPSSFVADYPFAAPLDRKAVWQVLLQAYVLARQAGMSAGFLYEPPVPSSPYATPDVDFAWPIPDETQLLVLPASPGLTAPGWKRLEEWVRNGGTLYCSYRALWSTDRFEELFGCRHDMRCGIPDVPAEQIEWTFKRTFGPFASGERLRYARLGNAQDCAFCPVEPTTAEVIAQDAQGRPALLVNRLDSGRVVFSIYPLEYYLSNTLDFHKADATYRLYQALMAVAGIQPQFLFTHPCVECAWLEGEGEFLVWLINHGWERAEGTLIAPVTAPTIQDVVTEQLATSRFVLEKKQVRVLKVVF